MVLDGRALHFFFPIVTFIGVSDTYNIMFCEVSKATENRESDIQNASMIKHV